MARVTAVGDGYEYDGVVVGHPVIQFGDGAPPAVVGYPLPKEPPPPPPPATLQRGRPEQRCSSRCGPCEIFTVLHWFRSLDVINGDALQFGKDASSAGSNSVWNFVLSAPDSGGYIAVGFSPNGKMVGGSAVAGWATPGAAGTARQYYLGGTTSSLCPPDQGKLSLSRGAAAPTIVSKGSRLYLAFQLSGQPLTNVIYAVGPAGTLPGPSGLLAQHKDMAAGTISLSGGTSGGGGSGTPATGGGGTPQ
ncbi:Os01g0893700 [Oryza sativa Japonica Group]|uniref:Os01g0893700 protein n=1 Tax=Oryza sativa subsp. japonica TaxID=39947 RepID=A0A0P0VBI6_ORYSJ|nr:hypothetical protein EE612_007336 [Oryza sativa]BAS75680.1 Os01g0893700 [Oryza sativa Japonica Group]